MPGWKRTCDSISGWEGLSMLSSCRSTTSFTLNSCSLTECCFVCYGSSSEILPRFKFIWSCISLLFKGTSSEYRPGIWSGECTFWTVMIFCASVLNVGCLGGLAFTKLPLLESSFVPPGYGTTIGWGFGFSGYANKLPINPPVAGTIGVMDGTGGGGSS